MSVPVAVRPASEFAVHYRTTFPALANGQPVQKTAAIPAGRGIYRKVDTTQGPLWTLPDQARQKAQGELAVLKQHQPREVLEQVFARSSDGANTFGHNIPFVAATRSALAARATDQIAGTTGPRLVYQTSSNAGLPPYPGSTLYYKEGRQAMRKPGKHGVPLAHSIVREQAQREAQGYVDANGFKIKERPQAW